MQHCIEDLISSFGWNVVNNGLETCQVLTK